MKTKLIFNLIFFTTLLSCNASNTSKNFDISEIKSINSNKETKTESRSVINQNKTNSEGEVSQTQPSNTNFFFNYIGEGTYISENEVSTQNAAFILTYSNLEGANRPSVEIQFGDGFELYFNASCDGEYSWCVRNSDFEDIAVMKLSFSNNGNDAYIEIKKISNSSRYDDYFDLISGRLVRV
jgi:hypothetical protein